MGQRFQKEVDLGVVMLAAVPRDVDRSLDLIFLALRIVARNEGEVPAELKAYFDRTLATAKRLTTGQVEVVPGKIDPAAIQLAIDMLQTNSLKSEISDLDHLDNIDAMRATKILSCMEQPVESAY